MNKQNRPTAFLRNGVILALAAVVISIFMPEWGTAQVLIVVFVALLAAFQFGLYFFIKKL